MVGEVPHGWRLSQDSSMQCWCNPENEVQVSPGRTAGCSLKLELHFVVFFLLLLFVCLFYLHPNQKWLQMTSEITRNNGNNRRERNTSFLSSRGNLGFLLHWHRLKQQYGLHSSLKEHFCPPSISTVPCLLLWRNRTSLRPVMHLKSMLKYYMGIRFAKDKAESNFNNTWPWFGRETGKDRHDPHPSPFKALGLLLSVFRWALLFPLIEAAWSVFVRLSRWKRWRSTTLTPFWLNSAKHFPLRAAVQD